MTPIDKGEIERLADSLEVSSGYEVPAAGQVMLDSARNLRSLLTQLSEAERDRGELRKALLAYEIAEGEVYSHDH